MMRWIITSSMNFRLLVVGVAVAIMVYGVVQLRDAPVDVLPEYDPVYVEIQTEALGLSANEVEELITVPLEQNLLNGVAWLDDIRSESVPGLSSIVLIFEDGTDPLRARQVVQERLTQARDLPRVSKPPAMIQPLSSTSRVMMVRLTSEEVSPIEMSVLARWTIRPQLMGIPGVANVALWGQRERQLQVQVDPTLLQEKGVTLDQVIESTGNALWVSPLSFLEASTPGVGGFIDTPNQRLGIQHLLPITTPEDLAQVPIEGCTGSFPTVTRHVDAICPAPPEARPLVHLSEVATVVEDHQPLIGDAVTGDGSSMLLVIEKFPEANTLNVTRDLEAAFETMQPGLTGIDVDTTVFRPATFIESAIDNVSIALLIGLFLALLIVAALIFDWRVALISVVAIPLALMTAGVVLHLRGATFNTMIFAGLLIALGAIVDDAIIDVDNIKRRLRQHRDEGDSRSTAAVIADASLEMRGPIIFATLIIVLAAVPVYYLGYSWGLSSSFFQPMVVSYALAILASLAVALTVTPALAYLLLSGVSQERLESKLMRGPRHGYGEILSRIVRQPRWTYAAVGIVAVLGLAVSPLLKQSMSPSFEENDLLVYWEAAPGTSHPEMVRITSNISGELQSVPGVRNVGAHVGRAVTSDQISSVNAGELWVSIDPSANYDNTVAAVEDVVNGYPGLYREVLTYLGERIEEVRTGSTADFAVRIYGQDQQVLRSKAAEVQQALLEIDGLVDERVDLAVEEPQLEIQVDLSAAQEYGIKPGDVRRAAAALVSGVEVGSLFEQQKVFEVLVWSTPETRHSLSSIQNLPIDTPDGGHVLLKDVAAVQFVPTPSSIKHDAVSRYIDVTANISGEDAESVERAVQQRLASIEFPLEHHAQVRNALADRDADEMRLLGFALAATAGIFLLLQAAFGSWRLAMLAFLTLPIALVGGVLAILVTDRVIELGSLIGLLTVLGITVRNVILQVSNYRRLEREQGTRLDTDLVVRGAQERMVPILLTALVTGVALLPFAIAGSRQGLEILHPMALVILGGLVTSTLVSLFIIPTLYLRFAPSPQPEPSPPQPSIDPAGSPIPASD